MEEKDNKQEPAEELPVVKVQLPNFSQPVITWKPNTDKVEILPVVRPGREEELIKD